jgi:hypothetical protein
MEFIKNIDHLTLPTQSAGGQNNKQMEYNITPGPDGGIFKPNATNFLPGDVIKLSGNYSYVYFEKLKGTPDNPILIQPAGIVTLAQGFDLKDCQFVKLVGMFSDGVKSFIIDQKSTNSSAVGVSIHGYSSDIDSSGIIFQNCGYGSWCKNEHFDDAGLQDWVLNNISMHDFEMINLASHGFYWGATEYPNKSRPTLINGVNVYYNPSKLGNIKIYNGKIRNVGRNGIMLCLADTGVSEIYNNDIDTTGLELNDQQGSGIQLGGYTSAYVHDNIINKTFLWGIRSFGGREVRIENNTIGITGDCGTGKPAWGLAPQSIAIGQDASFQSTAQKMFYTIKNNKAATIQVWKGNFADVNEICGNSGIVTVDAGVTYLSNTCAPPPPPPPVITKQLFLTAHVYMDKTISTAKSINTKKTLLTNIRIFDDGSVEPFK